MDRIRAFVLFFIFFATFLSCEKPEIPIDNTPLDLIVDKYVHSGLSPFFYILIKDRNGNIIYDYSAVNQDILPGETVDKNTLIRIWSMSKIVTITLIMDLIEDKILNLDEPVIKYIPEFKKLTVATNKEGTSLSMVDSMSKVCLYQEIPMNNDMTLRHLINHEAGFYYATTQNKCINQVIADKKLPRAYDSDDLINKISELPLIQQPGESHFYGTNTTVLGLVAERATGKSLKSLIKDRVTNLLGINGLKYNIDPYEKLLPQITGIDTILRVANDGELDIFGPEFPSYDFKNKVYLGGEGMVATADGYSDFLRIFINNGSLNGSRFLKSESIDEITSPHSQLDNKWGYNGYNLWVTSDTLRKSGWGDEGLWQGGGYEGTQFWIDSKREFVGVVMTQSNMLQKEAHGFYNDFRGELYKQIFDYEKK